MLFGVFAHVETHQFDAKLLCQDTRHLGLADAGRADEKQGGKRLVVVAQSGLRHLDGFYHLSHRLILSVDA